MSADLERASLRSSSATSVGSSGRALSANVRKLHHALNVLLSDAEREQFIHCLNVYHSKRNVYDLVQTLKVILNAPSKRQLLPMLRLVIPRSDQLLFDQYTSEGLYLKSELLASNGVPESAATDSVHTNSALSPATQPRAPPPRAPPRGSPDSFSTGSEGTAPAAPLLGRSSFPHEPPGEVRQVTLKRNKSNEGLGFSIRGGSEHGVGIYVSLVEPGSLAEKEGLVVGDQILKVNDKVFDRVTHAEAVKVRGSGLALGGAVGVLFFCARVSVCACARPLDTSVCQELKKEERNRCESEEECVGQESVVGPVLWPHAFVQLGNPRCSGSPGVLAVYAILERVPQVLPVLRALLHPRRHDAEEWCLGGRVCIAGTAHLVACGPRHGFESG
ncbi:hypothetical protein Z043_114654 [Scleropages formosus]|uniref:PDZ domain-containing protein n=1 Tax=Scleropages formosus TaxID=113540 RepID=A0A0P7UFL1_SCLFO|nr:hypothetical protein Z043_114654 [Scleropages formosus]